MSNQPTEHIVLRRRPSFRRPGIATSRAGASPMGAASAATAQPVVEQAQLTPREALDLQRDPAVQAICKSMPMKLIEPFNSPAAAPAAPGNAWGIEAVGAHTSPFTGAGVVVAVLDTGINPGHVAFQGVQLVRRNFTQGSDDDQNGHGTHCAGTIFGRDVGGMRIGVARGVTKALIGKVLGPGGGSSADLARAIQWAHENGANVISMSLGIDFPGFVEDLVKQQNLPIPAATSIALKQYHDNVDLFASLTRMLEQTGAFSQATIICAASGNESQRPEFAVSVAPPAAGDGMIAVGALGQAGGGAFKIAGFSNTLCDLCGPGVDVASAWIGGVQARKTISGTSMATPHVAGCAALWAQQQKQLLGTLNGENLMAKLLASAVFAPGAEFEDIGNGMVRAPQA